MAEMFSNGARHALDYLGLWIQASAARTVHIESRDANVICQCLLRLPHSIESVSVPDRGLVEPATWPWSIIERRTQMDAEVFPFSLEIGAPAPNAANVIACFRNSLSYRKLLYPRQPTLLIFRLLRGLKRRGYGVQDMAGIYPPAFVFWWALAVAVGHRASALHFQFQNRAFQRLSTGGTGRYGSYLVALHARR